MLENNKQSGVSYQKNNDLNNNKNLKMRKITGIFLVIFGVFLIFLAFSQFKNRINDPFVGEGSQTNKKSEEEISNLYIFTLENQDTDNDKVSDYDELFTYETSPYLEDTDSDNISDYDEISRGSDPNCPEGENCSISFGFENDIVSSSVEIDDLDTGSDIIYSEDETENSLIENMVAGEIDIPALRKLMITNGFSQEDVDQISDEELETIYIEAIANQATESETE